MDRLNFLPQMSESTLPLTDSVRSAELQLPLLGPFASRIDSNDLGWCVVDGELNVRTSNAIADQLLQRFELVDHDELSFFGTSHVQLLRTRLRQAVSARHNATPFALTHHRRRSESLQLLIYTQWLALQRNECVLLLFPAHKKLQFSVAEFAAQYALTTAEVRIVNKLVLGATPKQIAQQLAISIHTVRSQLQRVVRKTGLTTQLELCCYLRQCITAMCL